jgi:HAD superfamily hydrolase (TIGR01549 family)
MDYSEKRQNKKAVLFDLDQTLWDHEQTQKSAIESLCARYEIDFQVFYRFYPFFNREAWGALARKTITVDDMRVIRFSNTLKAAGITHVSPTRLSDEYLFLYRQLVHLVEGAKDVLASLNPFFTIGIITNGTLDVQKGKLDRSELKDYVDFMVTVDDAGCSKPSQDFFNQAFKKCGVHPRDITCVGDNYEEDIVGSLMAGAGCAVWFNPQGHPIPREFDIQPDFVISHLLDLLKVFRL